MSYTTKIKLRTDELSGWQQANPVLARGEAAVVLSGSLSKLKLGDGTTAFNALPYANDYSALLETLNIAQGFKAEAKQYSIAGGAFVSADGSFLQAFGVNAHAKNGEDYAFVWSGSSSGALGQPYSSHGSGTFSLNPLNGENGVFIGDKTLGETISADISAVVSLRVDKWIFVTSREDVAAFYIEEHYYEESIVYEEEIIASYDYTLYRNGQSVAYFLPEDSSLPVSCCIFTYYVDGIEYHLTAYLKNVNVFEFAMLSDVSDVPSKLSELSNDIGYATSADVSSIASIYSLSAKEDAVTEAVLSASAELSPLIPSKVSDLSNDLSLATEDYVRQYAWSIQSYETTSHECVGTSAIALDNRSFNKISKLSCGISCEFPAPIAGKSRDFLIELTQGDSTAYTVSFVKNSSDTSISFSTTYGETPFALMEAGKSYVYAFTEKSPECWFVSRRIEQDITQ